MPPAVIVFDFDPILRAGDVAVRAQTVALALTVLVSLALAARVASRLRLPVEDLLFITVGVVPGTVIAGRIGYVLGHLDYYTAHPEAILDPAQGTLTLGLAVIGGILTGSVVAWLLGASIRRWLHVATLPTLAGLCFGKLSMVLSGGGQGQPLDAAWATAYAGPGPWSTLAPEVASHPAQVYEALVVLATLVVVGLLAAAGAFRARDGRAFLVAIALWSLGRVLVGTVWRDAQVAGPFRVEQLFGLGVATVCLITIVLVARARSVPGPSRAELRAREVEWPDPATRPRF